MASVTSYFGSFATAFLKYPAILTAALLISIITSMVIYTGQRSRKLNFPVIGERGTNMDKEHLLEGVEKVDEYL